MRTFAPVRGSTRLASSAALLVLVALAVPARAQDAAAGGFPTATTLTALTTYPNFYHLKPVVVRGQITVKDNQARLVPAGGEGRGVELLYRGDQPSEGLAEVRGQFWDVGRLAQDDPHATALDLPGFVRARLGDRWPAHGELLVINLTAAAPVSPPSPRPSLRLLSLDPAHYDGQTVTVVGQFAGRNILGDLPQAPRITRTDFVLRNAGGAVWITGAAPRGRGWELSPDSKADTDQWLEAQGIVHYGDGLVWIQAKSLTQTKAEAAAPGDVQPATPTLPAPPPDVLFTLPAQDDTDVPPASSVKIQTSRDLDPESLQGHIAVSYLGQAQGAPPVAFKASFERGNRVLEIKFDQPLERFRTVKVDLQGVKGTDGQEMKPFTLTFSVGG